MKVFQNSLTRGRIVNITKIIQLAMVMPTTYAILKHSFSAFIAFQKYFRSIFMKEALNHLFVLHALKGTTIALEQAGITMDNFCGM